MGVGGWLAGAIGAVGLACFGSGCWAATEHFLIGNRAPLRAIAVLAIFLLGWMWFAGRLITSGIGQDAIYAVALMLAALALFWWAVTVTCERRLNTIFSLDRPNSLCEAGPYRFIRHPFYLAYILCWVGTSLATDDLRSWVVPALMSAIYVGQARQEERRFLASDFSDAYRRYRLRTGMFLPKLRFSRPMGSGGYA